MRRPSETRKLLYLLYSIRTICHSKYEGPPIMYISWKYQQTVYQKYLACEVFSLKTTVNVNQSARLRP